MERCLVIFSLVVVVVVMRGAPSVKGDAVGDGSALTKHFNDGAGANRVAQ